MSLVSLGGLAKVVRYTLLLCLGCGLVVGAGAADKGLSHETLHYSFLDPVEYVDADEYEAYVAAVDDPDEDEIYYSIRHYEAVVVLPAEQSIAEKGTDAMFSILGVLFFIMYLAVPWGYAFPEIGDVAGRVVFGIGVLYYLYGGLRTLRALAS